MEWVSIDVGEVLPTLAISFGRTAMHDDDCVSTDDDTAGILLSVNTVVDTDRGNKEDGNLFSTTASSAGTGDFSKLIFGAYEGLVIGETFSLGQVKSFRIVWLALLGAGLLGS